MELKCLLIGSTLALASTASSSLAQDGISLTMSFDQATGNVTLQWTGGAVPWEVFRSIDPATLADPANRLGEVNGSSWNDSPPPAELLFYRVNTCGLPMAVQPHGCSTCGCCESWSIRWNPVGCVTHYVVRWRCGISPEQAVNVGNVTLVGDICTDIGMCNGMCGFTISYVRVAACNGSGCSNAVEVPFDELPAACGGGCCC